MNNYDSEVLIRLLENFNSFAKPVTKGIRYRKEEFEVCPHCGKEIGEKELSYDGKDWFHRPCHDKGPISLNDNMWQGPVTTADPNANLEHAKLTESQEDVDTAAADFIHAIDIAIMFCRQQDNYGSAIQSLLTLRHKIDNAEEFNANIIGYKIQKTLLRIKDSFGEGTKEYDMLQAEAANLDKYT